MEACLRPQVSYHIINDNYQAEKEILEKSKNLKNKVKRTLGLCTTLCVCARRLYLRIIVYGHISDI